MDNRCYFFLGKVLHSENRAGNLVVEESGTDWETDYSEVGQVLGDP